jgi:hypothetical protein
VYYLYIILNISCFYSLLGTYQLVLEHKGMATNHERIESLEVDVYDVKEGIQHSEEGETSSADHMQRIE